MTTILVVDDSELFNKMLFDSLNACGYDVLQAHDATQAYRLVQKKIPNLIILDIVLPDVNGVQLCQTFRNHPPTRNLPIILMTGTAFSPAEKVKGLRSGADDYITKPFEMEELIERVRAVLRRSESRSNAPLSDTLTLESHKPIASDPLKAAQSIPLALRCALFSPASMPAPLPHISLFYCLITTLLISIGLLAAPGNSLKPVMVCFLALLLWSFLVSVLVVMASLSGLHFKWRDGATLLSFAGLPLLIKLLLACLFSAWTTLSPFLFTVSPVLLSAHWPTGVNRFDFFEIWSAVLLFKLLRQKQAPFAKAFLLSFSVWIMAVLAAIGLLRFAGVSS